MSSCWWVVPNSTYSTVLNRRVRAGSPLKALQNCLTGYRLWIPCLCHVKEVFSYLMFLLSNMKGCGSLSDACSEPMEMSLHSLLYLIQPSSCLHTPHHCSCHSSLIHCSSFDWLHSSGFSLGDSCSLWRWLQLSTLSLVILPHWHFLFYSPSYFCYTTFTSKH